MAYEIRLKTRKYVCMYVCMFFSIKRVVKSFVYTNMSTKFINNTGVMSDGL